MTAGRPLQYKTTEELQAAVDEYFILCKSEEEYPTISGLSYHLDLSRQGLLNYEGRDEFVDTIKRAKLRVETVLEQRLFHNNPTGCIFNLKNNFGWKDKQEHGYTDSEGNDSSFTVELISANKD